MKRNDIQWRGYFTAVVTPFSQDGRLDIQAWRDLLRWHASEGMHGLVLAGGTGEWYALSPAERADLFFAAADEVGGSLFLIGGCTAYTPQEVINHAQAAQAAGLDGIMFSPPPYVVPSDCEIVEFFRAVHDATSLPIMVYNWPPGTGVSMGPDLLGDLAQLDRVVAVKNSTGRLEDFIASLLRLHDELRVFGLVPSEATLGLLTHVGGDGAVGAGGVLGRIHPDFFNAVWAEDFKEAGRLAAIEQRMMRDWYAPGYKGRWGHSTATVKAALNLRGLPGGSPRPPLLPLGESGVSAVRKTLSELGLVGG